MPFFYQFQRCRIVNATWDDGTTYPEMVGLECTLMAPGETFDGVRLDAPCWITDLTHPTKPSVSYHVLESMIEPVQFDFDKEEEENVVEELEYAYVKRDMGTHVEYYGR